MRLSDDLAEAIAKAEELNAEVDAWRNGTISPHAPPAARARARRGGQPGSVEALIEDYRASEAWRRLAPRTRQGYGWCLDIIEAWGGDLPARAITPKAVQAFYESLLRRVEGTGRARRIIETPHKAAAVIRVLRLLLEAGRRLGYLRENPARRPDIVLPVKREPRIWSPEEVRHMAATADAMGWRSLGTAVLLNEWIGQREGDVLRLPPWRVEAESLVIRQGKTQRRVALPVYLIPHLVERLREDAEMRRVSSATHLLLNERTGRPWNGYTFVRVFAEARAKAAETMPSCAELRFMELRHTAVTRLHEAGVDALGIAGITGHTPDSVRTIVHRHYLRQTEKAAAVAFRTRLAAERNEG